MVEFVEDYKSEGETDPDMTPVQDRKLVTQPYDLSIQTLWDQIKSDIIHLRPISARPRFQRKYVWPSKLASQLIESIILNIPIPPIYLSQDTEGELDVIDGQQRVYSIFRFLENQFKLSNLEILSELNGLRFFELPKRLQIKLLSYYLRSVVVTNESHPEIKFEVFERLNSNTVPLNSQELRNCTYRGELIYLLNELTEFKPWLDILGRNLPDKRLRDEELILRFFSFHLLGLETYRTPLKFWLNDAARIGRHLNSQQVESLKDIWRDSITKALLIYPPSECFRRMAIDKNDKKKRGINRALMDITLQTVSSLSASEINNRADEFRSAMKDLQEKPEFDDLISRAVDHKKRVNRRFEMWAEVFPT